MNVFNRITTNTCQISSSNQNTSYVVSYDVTSRNRMFHSQLSFDSKQSFFDSHLAALQFDFIHLFHCDGHSSRVRSQLSSNIWKHLMNEFGLRSSELAIWHYHVHDMYACHNSRSNVPCSRVRSGNITNKFRIILHFEKLWKLHERCRAHPMDRIR